MFNNIIQHFKPKPAHSAFSPIGNSEPDGFVQTMTNNAEVPVEPNLRPHFEQPRGDLAGFFSALRVSAERYDMIHIAPLTALDPTVRFQLRTITVEAAPDNDQMLHELQALQPHIIKKAALNCLKQSQSAEHFDLSGFYGVIVTSGAEVAAGEAVMTLATIGVERIPLNFGFEGEHISVDPGEVHAVEIPASASDLTLHLRRRDGSLESLSAEFFPLRIGTSPTADIRVEGAYVSREHATLCFDKELGRVVLQDHSRHGTWFNGQALERNGRIILSGTGQITLSSPQHADAPVIEFGHAAIDLLQETPMVAPYGVNAAPIVNDAPVAVVVAAIPDAAAAPKETLAIFTTPRQEAAEMEISIGKSDTPLREPINSEPAQHEADSGSSNQTLMAPSHGRRPVSYLQVRNGAGVETVPIAEFPFAIGREPKGAGFTVDHNASFVSREHLKVVSFQHGHLKMENLGLGRNNTFRKGIIQDNHFLYRPVAPDSDSGWIVLGGRNLDEKCVEIRFLNARPESVQ